MAHVLQAPDAACEDVADGADAPRVGGVFVVVGHGRAECAMPLPLYFRGPKAGLPNRRRNTTIYGRYAKYLTPGNPGNPR